MIRSTPALGVCALTGMVAWGSLSAQTNLPDWSGQWEIAGFTPSATGGMQQSLDEALAVVRHWGPPPYTPEVRAAAEQADVFVEKESEEALKNGDSGVTRPTCTFGFPLIMLFSPLMFEVVPSPKETVLIFSAREVRHVYTDGRPHTPKDDLWPTTWGDSIGHWEGQTLVIDTIAVTGAVLELPLIPIIAFGGDANQVKLLAALSLQAHFIERLRMIGDQLEDRMTIIDPIAFSDPWHITRTYRRVAHVHRMVYEDCGGEERNPIVNGHYTLTPPPSPPAVLPPPLSQLVEALSGKSTPQK